MSGLHTQRCVEKFNSRHVVLLHDGRADGSYDGSSTNLCVPVQYTGRGIFQCVLKVCGGPSVGDYQSPLLLSTGEVVERWALPQGEL